MTVIVTRKPGGITQLFNTDTGRLTYKCKSDSAFMFIEAFGGIVKFNQKGATATVTGHITLLDFCDVLKKGHPDYKDALTKIIHSYKEFTQDILDTHNNEIKELENKLASL